MSDEQQPTPPPPSSSKTSAVPLKKETVRITLRARPGAGVTQPREATAPVASATGRVPSSTTSSITPPTAKKATAPIQLPSAPLPPPAPKRSTAPVTLPPAPRPPPSAPVPVVAPSAPVAPRPVPPPSPSAAPTAPRPPAAPSALRPAAPAAPTAPRPSVAAPVAPRPPVAAAPSAAPVAPSRPVAPGAPRVEQGATTQPLAPRPAPRPIGAGTAPMAAGAGTGALPKATVKLGQTQPMARPGLAKPTSAPVKRVPQVDTDHFYEEKDPEAGLVPLSVIGLIVAVALLAVQMFSTDVVTTAPAGQPSALMIPTDTAVQWETKDVSGTWRSSFDKLLPVIPE